MTYIVFNGTINYNPNLCILTILGCTLLFTLTHILVWNRIKWIYSEMKSVLIYEFCIWFRELSIYVFKLQFSAFQIWINSPHNATGYFSIYGDDSLHTDHFDAHLATGDSGISYARTGFLGFIRRTELTQSDGGKSSSARWNDVISHRNQYDFHWTS